MFDEYAQPGDLETNRHVDGGLRRRIYFIGVTAAVFILLAPTSAHAVMLACGVDLRETSKPLLVPPIAKAAHVQGDVTVLVTFAHDGQVEETQVLYGAEMLRLAATTFLSGWRAAPSLGSRTCPIVVHFQIAAQGENCKVIPDRDGQHPSVCAETILIETQNASLSSRSSRSVSKQP